MTTQSHPAAAEAADALLPVLYRALEAHAFDDGDPHGGTPVGRALLGLARRARAAAADLGADPGSTLADGSGVVVLRDLAAATRLLTRAADAARTPAVPPVPVTRRAPVPRHEPVPELATAER